MNTQEAFDKTVKFAFKQNKKCVDYNENCLYRGEEGSMCFVGSFIPDDIYDTEMEETSASGLIEDYPEVAMVLSLKGMDEAETGIFWNYIQRIHDSEKAVEWDVHFKSFADHYGLSTEVLSAY